LLSEASIGAGVRRVEALVGRDAYGFLAREHLLLNSLTQIIKGARVEELPSRISDLVEKLKGVEKELASFKTAQILASATNLLKSTSKIGGFEVLSAELESNISGDDLRTIALDLRNRLGDGIVILASKGDERSTLVVAVSPNALRVGIKAGALVKLGSEVLGGGGGGKDDFAQGGGSNHSEISNALSAMSKSIGQTVGK
jgi:alanyl-tRNA synthetase